MSKSFEKHHYMTDAVIKWLEANYTDQMFFKIEPSVLSGHSSNTETEKPINNPDFGIFTTPKAAYEAAVRVSSVWGDMIIRGVQSGNDRGVLFLDKNNRFTVPKHPVIHRTGKHLNGKLLLHLLERDSRRWEYDKLTACFSDKDADLNGGYVGVTVKDIDYDQTFEKWVLNCTAHFAATFCPMEGEKLNSAVNDDICNALPEVDTPAWNASCEWSGDDWFFSGHVNFPVQLNEPEELACRIEMWTWSSLQGVLKAIKNSRDKIKRICAEHEEKTATA